MRTGKLAEPVRKRSVLRQLNTDKACADKLYGTDCFMFEGAGHMVFAGPDGVPESEDRPERMVTAALNSLLAAGAKPQMLIVQGVLPADYEEADLQKDIKKMAAEARRYEGGEAACGCGVTATVEKSSPGLQVMAGQMEVSASVMKPHYVVNGIGWSEQAELLLQPGQDLVMTRWIALGGTAMLAQRFEEELHSRYPFSLIDRAKEFEKLTSAASDARAITHFGTAPMHALGQGGVFGALWEMAERAGVGLEVDLKKIPVKQETIEICEYFDINPYELYSAGSLLVGTEKAEALVAELEAKGIPAVLIGRATDGNDRLIRNGEDCRFLDRPKQDEWYRRIESR